MLMGAVSVRPRFQVFVIVHWVAQPRAKRLGWVVRSTTRSNTIIATFQEMVAIIVLLLVRFAHPIPMNSFFASLTQSNTIEVAA
jgi:hypothetical protein